MNASAKTPPAPGLPVILMVARERGLSRLVAAYAVVGMLFMLIPGTFLGALNLIRISESGSSPFTPAWMQAHGHAQIFGWIGSFILGIGFYSIPRATKAGKFALSRGWFCWGLWTLGVLLRWSSGLDGEHWRITLPLGSVLELVAFAIFFVTISGHKPTQPGHKLDRWILVVIVGTLGFAALLVLNLIFAITLAFSGHSAAVPPIANSRMLTLATWGFLVPFVWGFSARWLPTFLGLKTIDDRLLLAATVTTSLGVLIHAGGFTEVAMLVIFAGAGLAAYSLRIFNPAERAAKTIGVHPSFPAFVRIAYIWMIVAAALSVIAAFFDHHHGWWGSSRHAITVGFISTMVFAIGQRVLPAFAGMKMLFSPKLMFASLLILQVGCTLRVAGQALAYEGLAPFAWKVLPYSAGLEMTAILLFAVNMAVTISQGDAG